MLIVKLKMKNIYVFENYLRIIGCKTGMILNDQTKILLINSTIVPKCKISCSCSNASKQINRNEQRNNTTSMFKSVFTETNLKESIPFSSITAIKEIKCKNLKNFEADVGVSLCSVGFTCFFKRGMIKKSFFTLQNPMLEYMSQIFNDIGCGGGGEDVY